MNGEWMISGDYRWEDTERGLKMMRLNVGTRQEFTLRFVRMRYDGHLRLYVLDAPGAKYANLIVRERKREIAEVARQYRFPLANIEPVGNRFMGRVWGLRHAPMSDYFLAVGDWPEEQEAERE